MTGYKDFLAFIEVIINVNHNNKYLPTLVLRDRCVNNNDIPNTETNIIIGATIKYSLSNG